MDTYFGAIALAAVLWAGLWCLGWLMLRRRWMLIVGLAPTVPLAVLVLAGVTSLVVTILLVTFPLGIVSMIGMGKLIVASVGKRNVYARSRLKAGVVQAPPRGMVE